MRFSGRGPVRKAPIRRAVGLTVLITAAAGAAPANRLEVVVDPRVELMSLIFRPAGCGGSAASPTTRAEN